MSNWCLNTVAFICDEPTKQQLKVLFYEMARQESKSGKGQLPPGCPYKDGYFFQIRWDEKCVSFVTKMLPNIETMQFIARKYKVGFVQKYDEPCMLVYGEAVYENEVLTDIYLRDEDFSLYKINKDLQTCTFEGNTYLNEFVILDLLIDRKRAAFLSQN